MLPKQTQPQLVYCSIAGFIERDYAHRAGYDFLRNGRVDEWYWRTGSDAVAARKVGVA